MLKKILKTAFPTMISLTLSGMYSVIDGIFIGRAAGDVGLAAINIAWPITAVLTAVGIGIGTGGSVWISHERGRGNQKAGKEGVSHTITMLISAGAVITLLLLCSYKGLLRLLGASGEIYTEAVKYGKIIIAGAILQILGTGFLPILRNMEMAVAAMVSMIVGLAANVGINYYMMFVLGLGIKGAAYGTVAAQGIVSVISIMLLLKKQKIYPYLNKKLFFDTIMFGMTAFGMSIAPSVTLIFTNRQCLRYGGDVAVACYAVISYITFPVQYLLSGIGDGTQPLLSYYHGAGKKKEVKQIKKMAYRMAAVIGVAAMLMVICFAAYIGSWFGLSKQAEGYFVTGMRISALAFLLLGFVRFYTAYFNAILKTKTAVTLTYTESFLIAPVLVFVLPVFMGIKGVWFSFPLTAAAMLLLAIAYEKKEKGTRR